MTAGASPPPAIRITRPYATEEEFLEKELETLSRTGITLIGAQARSEGVVLRFELVLATGQVLVRGEGRVVGYKSGLQGALGGLALRFTRLDVRSKALVDKAAALRDQRRSVLPPPPPRISALPPPPFPRVSTPPPLPVRQSTPPPPLVAAAPASTARAVEAPPNRDELLDRLRARAKGLDAAAVQSILEQRARAEAGPAAG